MALDWKAIFKKTARSITEPVGAAAAEDSTFTSIKDCIRNGTAEDLSTWISKQHKSIHASHGVTVSKRNHVEMTPIQYAALLGMIDKVKILHQAGAHIDAPMSKGYTMPIIAAKSKSAETMAYALEHSKAHIDAQREYGVNALTEACTSGDADVVREILKKNPHLEAMHDSDPFKPTPLITAAKYGHTQIVELLLDAGADMDYLDSNGCSALWWSLHFKHLNTADCLLDHQAALSCRSKDDGTLLMQAAGAGHVPLVQRLLEDGINPNQTDDGGNTALHYTVLNERNENAQPIIDLLVQYDAQSSIKNGNGDTALTLAERLHRDNRETVQHLRTKTQDAAPINTDKFTDGSTRKIRTLKTIRLRSKNGPGL